MAAYIESPQWTALYTIPTSDAVLGGVGGPVNLPSEALANRTLWLRQELEKLGAAFNSALGNWTLGDLPARVTALEALPSRLATLEGSVTTLQGSYTSLASRVTVLENKPAPMDALSAFLCT